MSVYTRLREIAAVQGDERYAFSVLSDLRRVLDAIDKAAAVDQTSGDDLDGALEEMHRALYDVMAERP